MTATVPPVTDVAPSLVTRVKENDLQGATKMSLGLGFLLLAGSGLALLLAPEGEAGSFATKEFWFSYLTAYMYGLSLCLGALFFVMLQHVTRAGWSVTVRRTAEHMAGAIWVFVPLYIPILLGFEDLYHHWVHPAEGDTVVLGKVGYLNPTFFFVRLFLYFAVFIGLATFFKRTSLKQDETGDPALSLKMSRAAAPGLALFALATTFMAFDAMMSLDPHWYSTIFGVCYFAGSFMGFLAFVTVLCKWLGKKGYLKEAITTEHYHDLGKLLFGFMVFWTYVNFSQYFLIWYANIPEETLWYSHRAHDGWGLAGTVLIIGHFFVPFAYLMSRHVKRATIPLLAGAVFMLVMHWVDLQYIIVPNKVAHGDVMPGFSDGGHATWLTHVHWYDATLTLGMILVLAGLTLRTLRGSALVPERDPRLPESLKFQNQ